MGGLNVGYIGWHVALNRGRYALYCTSYRPQNGALVRMVRPLCTGNLETLIALCVLLREEQRKL